MYEWLPVVTYHFPGITPLNIYDLTFDWWRVYLGNARAIADSKSQAKARR